MLPRVDFPVFDGDHAQVWKSRCEKYFRVYDVPVHLWVHFATVNFKGNAALWLLTYEAQHNIDSWPDLCVAIEQKFGRDLYQNYMRDLLSLRQTSDVLEYAERFEQAKHRVLVHNREIGEVFFVQKLIDGLKFNISNVIALHKARTVDAALSLAVMQEQILESASRRFPSRGREYSRSVVKTSSMHTDTARVLGSPPSLSKPSEEKHREDKQRPKWDSKYESLRAKRRAAGLCMKCGEPFSPQHRCAKQVSLHVVEEMMELFQQDATEDKASDTSSQSSEEELFSISVAAATGT
jgi:hypothetical protein